MIKTSANSETKPVPPKFRARLLSIQESAQYLGISHDVVRNYISTGILPTVKLPSCKEGMRLRRVVIDIDDLNALIAKSKL